MLVSNWVLAHFNKKKANSATSRNHTFFWILEYWAFWREIIFGIKTLKILRVKGINTNDARGKKICKNLSPFLFDTDFNIPRTSRCIWVLFQLLNFPNHLPEVQLNQKAFPVPAAQHNLQNWNFHFILQHLRQLDLMHFIQNL